MPRYYCDYCDTYLTHDSPSVRKQHNAGYKHKANVRTYYQQFEAQQNQSLIDQKIKEHLGQTAVYQQVGPTYNQMRPRLPILPTPMLPIAGNGQFPVNSLPGVRPPVFPRPLPGTPGDMMFRNGNMVFLSLTAGYMSAPMMPPMVAPPGAPMPGQVNGPPRLPTMSGPTGVPGSMAAPTASGPASMVFPVTYQASSAAPTSGGGGGFDLNAQPPEANH
ncbi:hypothetical protein RHSIM_Rhsim13G0017700 [Rhododendron simsii]|uniref:U1 small nuclear ribonucleoprotein C n=1 Tax=Rhododendron simsii TaxID=118357 RepID=A0A834G129_RHOSS|nr:hypothetical protein RHSIM_Rhsim13G0017700 [Rhododendron simsii]